MTIEKKRKKQKRNRTVQVQLESLSFCPLNPGLKPKYCSRKRLQSPSDDDSWGGGGVEIVVLKSRYIIRLGSYIITEYVKAIVCGHM